MNRHILTPEDRRKGGLACASTPGHMQEIAKRSGGGQAVFKKHGSAHMKKIGAQGGKRLHQIYKMTPAGQSGWALVRRDTGLPAFTIGSVPRELKAYIERLRQERRRS